jgi:hypothetical protein
LREISVAAKAPFEADFSIEVQKHLGCGRSKSAVNDEFFPAKAVSLTLFEHVFVLRVSDGQRSLRSGAGYTL